jgi:hypothetical protein
MPVKDQILHTCSGLLMPAFAGTTEGTGAHVRRAGESRHPGVIPKRSLLNEDSINFVFIDYT